LEVEIMGDSFKVANQPLHRFYDFTVNSRGFKLVTLH
jgi:hypothetical protein